MIPKGGIAWGAMTRAMVATGIVFFPAAPLFLFMHGKDITIPKGTEITAYINGDTRLGEVKFQAPNSTPGATPAATVAAEAELEITSAPPDIEVDGKFVGNTPSSISVVPVTTTSRSRKRGSSPGSARLQSRPDTLTSLRS